MLFTQEIPTPLGPMTAIAGDRGLLLCEFADRPMLPTQLQKVNTLFGELPEVGRHEYLDQTRQELAEYFAGTRATFSVPLALAGTPFQRSVWSEVLQIPFGTTTSYEGLAKRIARPGAARAVGRANGDNRIAIIVPCHRVIGADGSLTGYGAGRHRKQWLLTHEQRGLQLALPSMRLAVPSDLPDLQLLIGESVRQLSRGYYTNAQIESALRFVFGVDTQLIADGTYYVIESNDGLAAAGGWSRRQTLYGGDQVKHGEDPVLDPTRDAARIRAFFVHPDWARRGMARALFERCLIAARAEGFKQLELAATTPGEPLYAALGFEAVERYAVPMPDGTELPLVRMTRPIGPPTVTSSDSHR